MLKERYPGIENEKDLREIIKSLAESVYPYRRMGNNVAADLAEDTIKALSAIKFES